MLLWKNLQNNLLGKNASFIQLLQMTAAYRASLRKLMMEAWSLREIPADGKSSISTLSPVSEKEKRKEKGHCVGLNRCDGSQHGRGRYLCFTFTVQIMYRIPILMLYFWNHYTRLLVSWFLLTHERIEKYIEKQAFCGRIRIVSRMWKSVSFIVLCFLAMKVEQTKQSAIIW